jgi:hypothetical protein
LLLTQHRLGHSVARLDRRMNELASSRRRHDSGSAPSASHRQHHDVEAPRVDDRNILAGLAGAYAA